MKSKIGFFVFAVMVLLLTIGSAMALEQVGRSGITDANQNWLTGTKGTGAYTLNWTDLGQSAVMPLVYDLDGNGVNEIIHSRNSTIRILALNGSVLESTTFAGLQDRPLSAYNSTECASGKALFGVNSTGTAFELCWDGANLALSQTCDATNASVNNFEGISMMAQAGSIYGAFAFVGTGLNQVEICDFTGVETTNIYLIYSNYTGVLSTGNPFNDGEVYWLMPYYQNSTSEGVAMFNKGGSISYRGRLSMVSGSLPIFIKRGSGNEDGILIKYTQSGGYGYQSYSYQDSSGYVYADGGTFLVPSVNFGGSISNPVQLGTDGDICYFTHEGINTGEYRFRCIDPYSLGMTYSELMSVETATPYLAAMDMSNDGYADYFYIANSTAQLCIYTGSNTSLSCAALAGGVPDFVYGVDADNDGKRDIIYSDTTNDRLRVFLTGGSILPNATTCSDTDSVSFPTTNNYLQGNMSATGITTRTDYCNGNYVLEYHCINSTTYYPFPVSFDCTSVGMVCSAGACVASNTTGTCDDSDSLVYPTRNYNVSGTAVIDNGTSSSNQEDYCLTQTNLIEFYCSSPTLALMSNLSYSCAAQGMVCSDGACVLDTCPSGVDYYSYPTIWQDTFAYADSITNHHWVGYPFVPGENIYDMCNALFMDADVSQAKLNYTFNGTLSSNFTFRLDMFLESTGLNNSPVDNGMPADIMFDSLSGSHGIYIEFAADGLIYNHNNNAGTDVIGNWQNVWSSYKLIVYPETYTYDFYFTNSTNALDYVLGCSNCTFKNNESLRKFVIDPQPYYPDTYQSVGVWVDNIKLDIGVAQQVQDTTNFCYFDGCIFFDHFAYTDDTYAHGWYAFNTTPIDSRYIIYANSNGNYFEHYFDTFRYNDSDTINIQFRAMFPEPPQTALDMIDVNLYSDYTSTPIHLSFRNGVIFGEDSSTASYSYGEWEVYTMVIRLADDSYDLYIGTNKVIDDKPITNVASSVDRIGFFVNTNSSVYIDYVAVSSVSLFEATASDNGVTPSDLRNCITSNRTFDWSCCSAEEEASKSGLCPIRVGFRYVLANIAQFIFDNFIYFLILIIIFVITLPIILPMLRRQP